MKLYLAGVNGPDRAEPTAGLNVLTTYREMRGRGPNFPIDLMNKYKFNSYFCDCGAYSAWTRGETLDIHEYCKYIIQTHGAFSLYAHLDVKGDTDATMENLRIMEEDYGLKPLPVFHLKTRNRELFDKMIEKYDYIAIGAIAGETEVAQVLTNSLNRIFKKAMEYGKDKDGNMIKKFHSFGATGSDWLLAYPRYSADSTSRLNGARFGTMPVYDKKRNKVVAINFNDAKLLYKNINNLPPELRNLHELLDDKSKGVKNYRNRLRVSAIAFKYLQDLVTKIRERRGIKFE